MPGATCPMCNSEISADTEQDLIQELRQHAKEHHDKELSEEDAQKMVSQQSE